MTAHGTADTYESEQRLSDRSGTFSSSHAFNSPRRDDAPADVTVCPAGTMDCRVPAFNITVEMCKWQADLPLADRYRVRSNSWRAHRGED